MALYSKSEFSKLCGIKSNQLAVHIKRGDVVLSKLKGYEDYVDSENEYTKRFVARRIARKRNAKQKAERIIYQIASKYKMKLTDMTALAKDLEDCINEAADDVIKHKQYLRLTHYYIE